MTEKEKVRKIEDITWVWDNTQGEAKVSAFKYGSRDEIHLTRNKFDKWFSPSLEGIYIDFKSNKFRPNDLDAFARFNNSYYQTKGPDSYDTLLVFSFTKDEEIMKQEGKWIMVKQLKKQPSITQIKDFMF